MQTIYWAHSYRDDDAALNRHVGQLLDAEHIVVNLDPPSDKVNAAKLERNLRACDGMVAVLGWRPTGPSPYILFEIRLCLRAHKPLLVLLDDRLPDRPIPSRILQRRYSHTTYFRDIRNQTHALRQLKEYMGDAPPPRYQPVSSQRACGLLGLAGLSARQQATALDRISESGFHPIELEGLELDDPFMFEAHEDIASLDIAVSCVDSQDARSHYLRGALNAEAVPTISFSVDKRFELTASYPEEFQARPVEMPGRLDLDQMLNEELDLFEQTFLTVDDPAAIDRYTKMQLDAGRLDGRYEPGTRAQFMEIVMGDKHVGDRYSVSGQAAAVGPNAHVHDVNFTQSWQQIEGSVDTDRLADELAQLRQELETQGTDPEHKLAAGAVAAAEASARRGDGPKALEYLATAGKWALGVAEKIGVVLATSAIKTALGL